MLTFSVIYRDRRDSQFKPNPLHQQRNHSENQATSENFTNDPLAQDIIENMLTERGWHNIQSITSSNFGISRDHVHRLSTSKHFAHHKVYLYWLKINLPTMQKNDFSIKEFKTKVFSSTSSDVRINRFPFIANELNRKDQFVRNLRKFSSQQQHSDFQFSHPETFILGEDESKLLDSILNNDVHFGFIAKPCFGGRGHGIQVFPYLNKTKTQVYSETE